MNGNIAIVSSFCAKSSNAFLVWSIQQGMKSGSQKSDRAGKARNTHLKLSRQIFSAARILFVLFRRRDRRERSTPLPFRH